MTKVVGTIDYKALDDHSRFFIDYVYAIERGVQPFLEGVRGGDGFWEGKRDAAVKSAFGEDAALWQAVCDDVEALSSRLGASPEVLDKLRLALSRKTHFIVTGQQPGALGGPLHTAYKIATTIALAERIERVVEAPCVPLYWCGGDDVDFQEIRQVMLLTSDLSSVSAAMPQAAHDSGMPVGDIAIDRPRRLWEGVAPLIEASPGAGYVTGVVNDAIDRANDHGELAAAIHTALFRGRIAVVDGRSAAVRRYAQAIISRYVHDEDVVKDDLREAGRQLDGAGYHAQLSVGEDSGVFLIDGGLRKNVAPDQLSALLDAVDNNVERTSPGVVARNLIQDYTFKPLAVVLGPAELAYRAQLGKLYQRFSVPRPAEFPRFHATFIPAALAGLVSPERNGDVATLVREPNRFARAMYDAAVPPDLAAAAAELRASVTEVAEKFQRSISTNTSGKALSRLGQRLGDVLKRVDGLVEATKETGKDAALSKWPMLSHLTQAIRPGEKLQERTVSALTPFIYGGEAMGDGLVEIASKHANEVLDAHPRHIVYSSTP